MGSEAKMVSAMTIKLVAAWCDGVLVTEKDPYDPSVTNLAFNFQTSEGVVRAHIGDTIIKKHDGTFEKWEGQPL